MAEFKVMDLRSETSSKIIFEDSQLANVARLLWLAIGLTLFVMTFGSLVRARDAGLSCPDWPLCYGQLVPWFDVSIFLEWFHRLLAAGLGLILIALCWKVLRSVRLRNLFSFQLYAAASLLMVQIVLGGLTVLQMIEPKIVSLHLINAVFFLAVMLAMAIRTDVLRRIVQQNDAATPPRKLVRLSGLTSLVILAQIFVGGMVSTNFAGTVCPDFPQCFGQWLPAWTFPVALQMGHRYLAFIAAALVIAYAIAAIRSQRGLLFTQVAGRILPLLITVQFVLGMVNVYGALPTWSTVAHLANALFIFVIVFAGYCEVSDLRHLRNLNVDATVGADSWHNRVNLVKI